MECEEMGRIFNYGVSEKGGIKVMPFFLKDKIP